MGKSFTLTSSQILSVTTTDYWGDDLICKGGSPSMFLLDGGYADIKNHTTMTWHYYIKDHLGSNRIVQDGNGKVETSYNYYPFGNTFEHHGEIYGYNKANQPYKFSGKESEWLRGTYDFGARQYDPLLCRWTSIDPLCEKYYSVSPYVYCMNNPVKNVDPDGRKTILFATKLPGDVNSDNFFLHTLLGFATHTFVAVFDNKTNELRGYYAFGPRECWTSGPLEKMSIQDGHHEQYDQDRQIIKEYQAGEADKDSRCKSAWSIETVDPSKQEQFDNNVITTGNNYEPISTAEYYIAPSTSDGTVNCNKGSYNLLKQAGVSEDLLKYIGERLPGTIWGWGQNMPWTLDEQYTDYGKRCNWCK